MGCSGRVSKMKDDLLGIIDQISRQRELSRDVLIEAIEKALLQAAKKRYGSHRQISATIDRDTGEIKVIAPKKVVEIMTDFSTQIPVEEALTIDPNAKVGQIIEVEAMPRDFGRIAAQTAKQIVAQKLREAERENIYEEYKDREGEIVSGTVQRREYNDVIVELDRVEGLLPYREQIRGEEYRRGDRLRVLIIEVAKHESRGGSQIILSRTHPDLLRRLFELEVPEIYDGLVEIKAIAREPGDRSKIAVATNVENLDAVGTCVGMRGSRVQMVVHELGGERIDILPWNLVPGTFIASALSPAKIVSVSVDEDEDSAKVVVPDDQLSLAIGRKGQNVRLAAKLTGWNIDIKSQSEAEAEAKRKIAKSIFKSAPVTDLEGVGSKIAGKLLEAGFSSVEDIADTDVEHLVEVPGIGAKTAQKLHSAALERITELKAKG
jgi:N utilization substance protein A